MTIKDTDSPAKRRKLNADQPQEALEAIEHHNQGSIYKGLDRSISPPLSRRRSPATPRYKLKPNRGIEDVPKEALTSTALELDAHQDRGKERERIGKRSTKYVPSPFQLTHIQDLRSHQNVDAVQLKDILGNPMIKECWNFNYLFDLSFVM
jgi:tyrosyl-DNA phosphodiesterase-1